MLYNSLHTSCAGCMKCAKKSIYKHLKGGTHPSKFVCVCVCVTTKQHIVVLVVGTRVLLQICLNYEMQ